MSLCTKFMITVELGLSGTGPSSTGKQIVLYTFCASYLHEQRWCWFPDCNTKQTCVCKPCKVGTDGRHPAMHPGQRASFSMPVKYRVVSRRQSLACMSAARARPSAGVWSPSQIRAFVSIGCRLVRCCRGMCEHAAGPPASFGLHLSVLGQSGLVQEQHCHVISVIAAHWCSLSRGVAEMRQELVKLAAWAGEIEAMRMGTTMGSLHLEAGTLRLALLPIVTRAQTQAYLLNCLPANLPVPRPCLYALTTWPPDI